MRVSILQARSCILRSTVFLVASVLFFPAAASGQQRISLAGYWERWIAGQLYDNVLVPSSYRPVGTAVLVRVADFPQLATEQRMLLRFEGIAGNGTLRVNGHQIGILAPYTTHVFDVTNEVKPGPNKIEMELVDWQAPLGLGPAAAWESSGGIIYNAYAEIRTDPYIENARLTYRLSPDFKTRRLHTRCFRSRHHDAGCPHNIRSTATAESCRTRAARCEGERGEQPSHRFTGQSTRFICGRRKTRRYTTLQ